MLDIIKKYNSDTEVNCHYCNNAENKVNRQMNSQLFKSGVLCNTKTTPLNDWRYSKIIKFGETLYSSTVAALSGLLKRTVFRRKLSLLQICIIAGVE